MQDPLKESPLTKFNALKYLTAELCGQPGDKFENLHPSYCPLWRWTIKFAGVEITHYLERPRWFLYSHRNYQGRYVGAMQQALFFQ
jgi:hypothetical protein